MSENQNELKPLLPCPFCGGEAKITADTHHPYVGTGYPVWWVGCDNDKCFFQSENEFTDEGKAIAAWNTRATSPAERQIEAIRERYSLALYFPADHVPIFLEEIEKILEEGDGRASAKVLRGTGKDEMVFPEDERATR